MVFSDLTPTWVPRGLNPGKRMKLHPADLFAYGQNRGAIIERWLSSTTKAENGLLTTPFEGLSFVVYGEEERPKKVLLKDLVLDLGPDLLGDALWDKYHAWPVFSKFFDNKGALPFHMHHQAEHAALMGAQPKPESYYYPLQLNSYEGDFPFTFFGFEPGVSKEEIRYCLETWKQGDNHILDLSRAYKLEPGTGWFVAAGVLHAPGSLCTYEPQWASDIGAGFQSMYNGIPIDWMSVARNVPEGKRDDLDFILSLVDWEANTLPEFKKKFFRKPIPVKTIQEMNDQGYREYWISYGNVYFAAKELTVLPGRKVTIKDVGPYGMVMLQGHGQMGTWPIETPAIIRFGQLTHDEYFVSARSALAGVTIQNLSTTDPIVMLKHFRPNPESPAIVD